MDIKSFLNQYKYYVLAIAAGLIVFTYLLVSFINQPEETLSFEYSEDTEDISESAAEPPELPTTVFVEVKGAVVSPGVYELPADARVKNVLDVAVLSENADLLTVNQSAKLTDEMVVYIPYEGEIDDETAVKTFSTAAKENVAAGQVNINTASIAELTTLNGIGEKKAQAILTYREEQGLFTTLEEIKNIPGIGDKTFENLKPYITIN
ncbi:ComE operon protein 1 [Jeotgalicoccus aerolatus]|uniref:Competence protein ComEA n=1 Tax=Jeotgalicoccus aerolatus TaxID=709510 RepID=A0A1G8UJJ6_9STAP|nr:ComEA family DNA-binding protein [Jeotgalicoccus aerolatus]MBP1951666.1 competence protein ComEA [Jeotgalicoccus aerolatus]CAD2075693.1 ComE operon protein 1 [Jeotgalicoccus aerolatus]SDJ53951.1 competence protein ComEA [Jeotgalicoccus aerolatus]GGD95730.1 competence protein ComEA [Jeotgalicoccus aerolatus]HJG33667.1 ComEA family DNA-binding protein [Jeotgalicoccus aerolatus]